VLSYGVVGAAALASVEVEGCGGVAILLYNQSHSRVQGKSDVRAAQRAGEFFLALSDFFFSFRNFPSGF